MAGCSPRLFRRGAELVAARRHGGLGREAVGLDDLGEFARFLQLLQLDVEGIAQRHVLLAEGGAVAIDRRVDDGGDGFEVRILRLVHQIVDRQDRQRIDVDAAVLQHLDTALPIRNDDDAVTRNAGFQRQLFLSPAARRADLGVRIVGNILVARQLQRVALLESKGFGIAQDRFGIGNGVAAFGFHEQARRNCVVSAGLQAGDHRAVFRDRGDHFLDAELFEDHTRHIGGGARHLAVGADGGEWRLVGDGDAGKALLLQLFELVIGGGCRGGRRNQKHRQADGAQNISCFHRSQLLWLSL
ncbi:hypothetical protein RHECNPAF_2330097 [Rhizobium etli CNPAF512]|nr:hypothetical protein RHECNPAF_2330097 [Rhizobium etli CNPAF512]